MDKAMQEDIKETLSRLDPNCVAVLLTAEVGAVKPV